HTRSDRDWSSDVCSSDLAGSAHLHHVREVNGRFPLQDASLSVLLGRLRMPLDDVDPFDRDFAVETEHAEDLAGFSAILACDDDRSEERRVGKGGRLWRWW